MADRAGGKGEGNPAYDNITSIPLASPLYSRDGTLTYDTVTYNGLLGKDVRGAYVQKRPGIVPLDLARQTAVVPDTLGVPSAAICLGAFQLNEEFMVAGADGLYYTYSYYRGSFVAITDTPKLGGALPGRIASVTDSYQQGKVRAVMQWGRSLFRVNFSFNPFSVVQQFDISLTGSPDLVPGIQLLDNVWYCCTKQGYILSSNIGDPDNWPDNRKVQADQITGIPTCFIRHLSYLMVCGVSGIATYYDAGNPPPASALGPVANATFQVGIPTIARHTPINYEGITYFIGQAIGGAYGIYRISGLDIQKISSATVDRLLRLNLTKYAELLALKINQNLGFELFPFTLQANLAGHPMLLFQFPPFSDLSFGGLTLTYDIELNEFAPWTWEPPAGFSSYVEGMLPFGGTASSADRRLFVNYFGKLWLLQMNDAYYLDTTVRYNQASTPPAPVTGDSSIKFQVQTANYDWGTPRTKAVTATYIVADIAIDPSNFQLEWTDNDYGDFNNLGVTVPADTAKKQVIGCGSTIQRAWRITYTATAPMRLYQLYVELRPGAL